jgi:hypothetical protein
VFDLAHSFGACAEATGDLAPSLLAATDAMAGTDDDSLSLGKSR